MILTKIAKNLNLYIILHKIIIFYEIQNNLGNSHPLQKINTSELDVDNKLNFIPNRVHTRHKNAIL